MFEASNCLDETVRKKLVFPVLSDLNKIKVAFAFDQRDIDKYVCIEKFRESEPITVSDVVYWSSRPKLSQVKALLSEVEKVPY